MGRQTTLFRPISVSVTPSSQNKGQISTAVGAISWRAIGRVHQLYGLRDTDLIALAQGKVISFVYGEFLSDPGHCECGRLWLQNGNGVVMRLVAKRQWLMLGLGGDAVVIEMNQ
jgi:hypothetical protein